MKKFRLTALIVAAIITTQPAMAQSIGLDENPSSFKINCKRVTMDSGSQTTVLLDVSFMKNDKLEISNASKVVLDKAKKQVTIYDCKEFTFNGTVVKETCSSLKNILCYTINDDKIYLE